MSASHLRELQSGAEQLGIDVSPAQASQLIAYLELLQKWNKAYNLTAVRDPDEMVSRHLLDSLSVLPYTQGPRCLDVGSGGGMPGVILAIMNPQNLISVLDSNGKKTRFLTQVRVELGLENLTVINSRVEVYQPDHRYAVIVSRAFSSLADFTALTRHLGSDETRWLAMKGLYPEEELAALPVDFRVTESAQLSVPGCQGTRHLLILRRVTAADNG
ncbi:16S rRNA (guanine(527)-N(7))-methyltransferase RsmG [Halopseudomonas nanhaiensis]|uniref:16S rRNA (guanine(527)-N(7))-methyltransferase RsmG n=1 Tax=Halopseudomonas nanhaiensis TaxID=2830842 RepID=UPI001CBD449B|nr:16S rRNA (guanine(527)-N(7))-methyltransferase RsmG [Halopseudomonas nanhaiensis]UAW98407.1 16S rRNA (guanine(527)-N(7))-methyltransferase RsmG [Halopseudomonas nanhaiensis]